MTTAEVQGFGARAPYAQPRQSEYEMKERVRLSGLFPRVRNEPLSNQLQALMKEFDKNAALTGILERRRRLEERLQFELKGKEGMDALTRDLAPPYRAGLANAATSASVADRLQRSRVEDRVQEALRTARTPPDAAAVMTSAADSDANLTPYQRRRIAAQVKAAAAAKAKAAAKAGATPVAVTQHGGSVSSGTQQPALERVESDDVPRRRSKSRARP